MNDEALIVKISQLVECLDEEQALAAVQEAIDEGLDPLKILERGVVVGLKAAGDRFATGEYFLPELMMGARVSDACTAILTQYIPEGAITASKGVIVLGAVQGDIHDIGTSLVARQLSMAGYEVHNIGINVSSMTFIDKARELDATFIGLSAFLDTTRPFYAEVISYLRDMGLRDKYKVIIGGTAASDQVCESVGADGWAPHAAAAVELCDRLMAQ